VGGCVPGAGAEGPASGRGRGRPRCLQRGLFPGPSPAVPLLQLRYSAQSLFDYMKKIQHDASAMESFCETLLKVFEDNLRNDRYRFAFAVSLKPGVWHICFNMPG